MRYPADPPTIDEIVSVMRATGERPGGLRLRALIVNLWRAGLRASEALALAETDLDPRRGAVIVQRGKGGRRREIGIDRCAWAQLAPWLAIRSTLPAGGSFCVIHDRHPGAAGRHQPPAHPTRKPRNHIHLPARHRWRRDHRHGPCKARTSDLSHGRTEPRSITSSHPRVAHHLDGTPRRSPRN